MDASTKEFEFDKALTFTLQWEKEKSISQGVYDSWRLGKGYKMRRVSEMTQTEERSIYYEYYWKRCFAEEMTLPLAVVMFDTAIEFGIRAAIRMLQELLGIKTRDGVFGKETLEKLNQSNNNLRTAKMFCEARINFRHKRIKESPSLKKELSNWLKRDLALKKYIEEIVNSEHRIKLNMIRDYVLHLRGDIDVLLNLLE